MKTPIATSIRYILLATAVALEPSLIHAAAASPSELLEKGIYNEETKGDVDAAIAIYEQIVTEAKTSQSLAAQAQFRLGQCLVKKNRSADAAAAFEKLIREFPNEKELIAKAREFLPSEIALGPVTWVDGERLQINLTLPTGRDVGTMVLRADLVNLNGKKVWRVGRRMSGGAEMVSSVDVDAETFRPLTSRWKHTLLGEATATFRPDEVEVHNSAGQPTKIHVDKTVFDNEQAFHLLRLLPLQVGYKSTLPLVATLGAMAIPVGLEVNTKETLNVPAGKFDCFQVQLSIGQVLWVSDDEHRYIVKFEAGGAIGQLAAISKSKPGEATQFRDEELGVSLTAPANWVIYRPKNGQPNKQALIRTYDPEGDSDDGGMRLFTTDTLSTTARSSVRAWAEEDFRNRLTKDIPDAKIRPDSWKTYNVSGRPGISFVMDCTESGKPRVLFSLYVLGPKTSEQFLLVSAPDKFDGLKAAFDQIIASYRISK